MITHVLNMATNRVFTVEKEVLPINVYLIFVFHDNTIFWNGKYI